MDIFFIRNYCRFLNGTVTNTAATRSGANEHGRAERACRGAERGDEEYVEMCSSSGKI